MPLAGYPALQYLQSGRVSDFSSPNTREVQFDEKWSFVFKKQEHCDPDDPADDHHGDWWDHVVRAPRVPAGAGRRPRAGCRGRRWR